MSLRVSLDLNESLWMVVLTPSPEGFRKIKGTLSDYSVTRESREKAAAAFLVQDEFEPRLLPKTKSKSLSCSSSLPCSLWAMASLVVFIALHLEGRSLSDETLFQSSTGDMDRHTYQELIYIKKRCSSSSSPWHWGLPQSCITSDTMKSSTLQCL